MDRSAADMAEKAAKRRPRHKADTDCRAEKTHILGAFFRRCPVGDHRLDHAGVA